MKNLAYSVILLGITTSIFAQSDTTRNTFWHLNSPNYTVNQAVEVESLFITHQ